LDREAERTVELSNADCGFAYRASIFNTTAREKYVVLAVTFALTPNGAPCVRYADLRNHFAGHDHEPTLAEVRDAVRAIRARKAMLLSPGDSRSGADPDSRSAGSFFKNPLVNATGLRAVEAKARELGLLPSDKNVPVYPQPDGRFKVAAAWLIEQAGFAKGYQRGRVAISSRHTLALTNRGGASASEILALMREIQAGVRERFGVELHPEPVFVGFD
jgi:UDP-N-acetylmuramate dehydrogenase